MIDFSISQTKDFINEKMLDGIQKNIMVKIGNLTICIDGAMSDKKIKDYCENFIAEIKSIIENR